MRDVQQIIPYKIIFQNIEYGNQMLEEHKKENHGECLEVILEGSGKYKYKDVIFPVKAGDIFVIRGKYTGEIREAANLKLARIFYHDDFVHVATFKRMSGWQAIFVVNPLMGTYQKPENRLHADKETIAEFRCIIGKMYEEQLNREPGYEQILNSAFFILITLISRKYQQAKQQREDSITRFAQAVAYMEDRYWEAIKLSDLAAMVNVSERHFMRRFREIYNTTPVQYLLELRLRRSLILLGQPDLTIGQVAMECGFNDPNYFSRSFKRMFQMTPGQYRKMTY